MCWGRRRRQSLGSGQFRRGNGLVLEEARFLGRIERERAYDRLVDGLLPVRDARQEARLVAVVAAHVFYAVASVHDACSTSRWQLLQAWGAQFFTRLARKVQIEIFDSLRGPSGP